MKCKLNDLCFLVKTEITDNIGKVVKTVEYLGYFKEGDCVRFNKRFWNTPVSDHYWLIKGTLKDDKGLTVEFAPKPDRWLTPIKCEPLEDTESFIKELNLELVK